jgi:hypothetical protein
MKVLLFSLITMLLISHSVSSQETTLTPRRLLLLYEDLPDNELSEAERLIVQESLLVRLHSEAGVVVLENLEGRLFASESERNGFTLESGADSWLVVSVGGNANAVVIRARSYDLLADKPGFELEFEPRKLMELERALWDDLIVAVREGFQSLSETKTTIVERPSDALLRLKAIPGTQIRGLAEELVIGESGESTVRLKSDATYTVRATKAGYDPLRYTFLMEGPETEVLLPQRKASRWGLEFYLNNLMYPGIEASLFLLPNSWYVRLGINTFIIGLPLRDTTVGDRISFGLTHLNLSSGYYFNAADHLLRFYVSAGAFLRITHLQDQPFIGFALDPIAAFGFFPAVGIEVRGMPKFRFFLEYRPLFYLTDRPELMAASYAKSLTEGGSEEDGDPDVRPPYVFSENIVFDYTNFNLGVRIEL